MFKRNLILQVISVARHQEIEMIKLQAELFSERLRQQRGISKGYKNTNFKSEDESSNTRGNVFLRPMGRKKRKKTIYRKNLEIEKELRNDSWLVTIFLYLSNEQKMAKRRRMIKGISKTKTNAD